MKLDLIVSDRAERQIDMIYEWYEVRDSASAERWFSALMDTLDLACLHPADYPSVYESRSFPVRLQQAVFGAGRKVTHRCVFSVRPEGLFLHAVRHLAPDELDPDTWNDFES